jgi:lysophospholipase L1-like esterase
MKKILNIALTIGLVSLLFRKMKIKGQTALIVGDSHSAGYGWGWQDVLAKNYGFKVINIAKSGYTIPQMFKDMKNFYKSNSVPIVFIYGGANDIFNNKNQIEALSEMQQMVDYALSKGSKVVLIAGFESAVISKGKDKKFIANYDLFKQRLSSINNVTFVPMWKGGVGADSPDGYHLRADAQKRFADYIGKSILSK